MTCIDIQRQLHEVQQLEAELSAEVEDHLSRCTDCQKVRQDLLALRGALQVMPPPALPNGFELSLRRSLAQAATEREHGRPARGRGKTLVAAVAALAAMVVVVLGVSLWLARQPAAPSAELAHYQLQLSIVSPQDHARALVDIELPEGVRAEPSVARLLGGDGQLRWQSELGAGTNEIDLPLTAPQGSTSEVKVRLTVAGRTVTSSVSLAARAEHSVVKLALAMEPRRTQWH
jgi:hypothetical protein